MKVVVGLGNPGPEHDAARHNVGWWVVDRLAYDWGFDLFRREGRAFVTEGTVGETQVRLIKPTTYMNRSGLSLRPLRSLESFEAAEDLLIVIDDAALDVGRVRFRPDGADLADWVLSEMPEQDEDIVVALLPELTGAVELWINEGSEAAMNSFNR